MSGIVGIVNLDGAPVDERLLSRMTAFMTFRGPDAQRTWVAGSVGFGHTLLKTTYESEHESQPFTLDGQQWIVADARVDARATLIDELKDHGEEVEISATDVELLLRAYRVWGTDCTQHLLGDFAFAVWDTPRRRLFCARDQLGVKSFFYANLGQNLVFSNTLDCIRLHPSVSDTLNDSAVADFLLFDANQGPETTFFADVRRIPPAHSAIWSPEQHRVARYWTLPVDEPILFRRAGDYTDRFNELAETAVTDRLRTDRVGVFMSGGLDSSTLAAVASRVLRRRNVAHGVQAFTTTIDGFDGNERRYAQLVAERLRIPVRFHDRSHSLIDTDWHSTGVHMPEPPRNVMTLASDRAEYQQVSRRSRVCFYGEGPDNALTYEWRPYLRHLFVQRRFGRLLGDVAGHVVRHRRIPLIPTIPRMFKEWRRRDGWRQSYPSWLEPTFESRLQLRARWEGHQQQVAASAQHPVRPRAYASFLGLNWEGLFRTLDAEDTGSALEVRHPFVDLRFLRYLLAVPAVPWCRAKLIVRQAMRDELPQSVLRRPKSPLSSDPGWVGARTHGLPPLVPTESFRAYVNPAKVPADAGSGMIAFGTNFRPRVLNYWLSNLRNGPKHAKEEMADEITPHSE